MKLDEKGLNPAIIKRYNGIMVDLGYEHECFGPEYECARDDDNSRWNLKDTVANMDYYLSTYYESGHSNEMLREDEPDVWRSHVGKMKRYIARYLPICKEFGLKTSERHCSKYDD